MPCLAFRRVLRSEEHTSELQSHSHLVCRLLLEKHKHKITTGPSGLIHDLLIQSRYTRSPTSTCHPADAAACSTWCLTPLPGLIFFFKGRAPPGNPPFPPPPPSSS